MTRVGIAVLHVCQSVSVYNSVSVRNPKNPLKHQHHTELSWKGGNYLCQKQKVLTHWKRHGLSSDIHITCECVYVLCGCIGDKSLNFWFAVMRMNTLVSNETTYTKQMPSLNQP